MSEVLDLTATEWFTVTGRGQMAVISSDQLPDHMATAAELINMTISIDGQIYLVAGAETCRVNHHGRRCEKPFGLLVSAVT